MLVSFLHDFITHNKSSGVLKKRFDFDTYYIGFEGTRRRVVCSAGVRAVMGKPPKFPGVSEEVQKLLDADMDSVDARRRAREAFKDVQLSIDHCLFKVYRKFFCSQHFFLSGILMWLSLCCWFKDWIFLFPFE